MNTFLKRSFRVMALSMLIPGMGMAQQWSETITLAPGDSPDIAVDRRNGNLHVVIMDNKVTYMRLDKDTNVLDQQDLPFGSATGKMGGFYGRATVAADTFGRPHIVWPQYLGDTPAGHPRFDLWYTYNTGSTWATPLLLSSDIVRGYAVRMAIDDDNDVHIIRGQMDGDDIPNSSARYYRIRNGNIQLETTLSPYRPDDHVEIDVYDRTNVHIVLGNPDQSGNRVIYFRSGNNGDSFVGPQKLEENTVTSRAGSPNVFADRSGNVHFIYGARADTETGGNPSIRYERRENGATVFDKRITGNGELTIWPGDEGIGVGIGTGAASDDGKFVVIAYQVTSGGQLRARISKDAGATFSEPTNLASQSGGAPNPGQHTEGRDKPVLRAYKNRFYLVYESFGSVRLRWIQLIGDPPTANAGGPYTGSEGTPITFDASASTDDGTIVQYAWDWDGDGVYDDSTASPTFQKTFADDYSATAVLRVTDNEDMVATQSFSITVNNVNPSVSVTGATPVNEGTEVSFTATVTDPGADTQTVSWDFGDGTSASGTNVTHTFTDNGFFTVTATATDDDGGTGSGTFSITVLNVAPTADAGGPYVGVRNEPVTLTGSATDPSSDDTITYAWDLDDNGTYEKNGKQVTVTYSELGTYTVRLRATDDDGDSSTDTAEITVGTGAPVTSAIPDQQVDEGMTFPVLNLDDYVTDPNNADSEITWTFFGNFNLNVTVQNRQATISPIDPEWSGVEIISFVATDPTSQRDTTTVKCTVLEVNDPPQISKIPDQTVDEGVPFAQVFLDNYVTDADNPKSALVWTVSGTSQLTITISNRVATIGKPNSDWAGSETVTYTVTDPLGESDSQQVTYTSVAFNDPPEVSSIPGQTIQENQSFAAIDLNQYVTDKDNPDNEITWTASGNRSLIVRIDAARIATIAPPDSEWVGSEFITFTATDPGGKSAASIAKFAVIGINDPPAIAGFTNYTIAEDDSMLFTPEELANMIIDPDNALGELEYTLPGAVNINVSYNDAEGLALFGDPDWYGSERFWLKVSDGEYADSTRIRLTVTAEPDPPKPFSLVAPVGLFYTGVPQQIEFIWEKSVDPDQGDVVTYTWEVSRSDSFTTVLLQNKLLQDTLLVFPAKAFFPEPNPSATYYWRVFAVSSDGSKRPARSAASFTLLQAVSVTDPARMPKTISLKQNYPNPFNPSTQIEYELPQSGEISLLVYDSRGRLVRTLVRGTHPAGTYRILWDARDDAGQKVASGVYLYRLEAAGTVLSRKMILMQ